jgi:hypothetical protein
LFDFSQTNQGQVSGQIKRSYFILQVYAIFIKLRYF